MKRLANKTKNSLRQVRHSRIRSHLIGTAKCPRLSVFRSLRFVTAQLIDDTAGRTLCQASGRGLKPEKSADRAAKVAVSFVVGKTLAEKAVKLGITEAIFDRSGYKYHGRVRALAEGARAGGLKF